MNIHFAEKKILIHVLPMVILGHNDVTLDGCNYLLQNYMQRHIDYTLFQTYMKGLQIFIQSIHKFNYHMTLLLFSR